MQAKDLPINDIQHQEYFCVVYRPINSYPFESPSKWNLNRLFFDENSADLYIIEQKKFEGKPWYRINEYKKFSILLPI